jgi:hypothetical protein
MKTIILTPKNKTELANLSAFIKKFNIDASYLTEDEKDDIGLKMLMRESNRKKTVSRATVIRKLKSV